jgi:hypothetical protein
MSIYNTVGQVDGTATWLPSIGDSATAYVCTAVSWHDLIRLSVTEVGTSRQTLLTVDQARDLIGHLQTAIARITKENQ